MKKSHDKYTPQPAKPLDTKAPPTFFFFAITSWSVSEMPVSEHIVVEISYGQEQVLELFYGLSENNIFYICYSKQLVK